MNLFIFIYLVKKPHNINNNKHVYKNIIYLLIFVKINKINTINIIFKHIKLLIKS